MNKYNEQGLEHGPWEDYYSNGKLYSRGNYVNGKLHGVFDYYFNTGVLCSRRNYINGKPHGLTEWYVYNGGINLRHLEFFL